jgi:hydroxyethylthiazole kinase-like uncharacterized protein yjeF
VWIACGPGNNGGDGLEAAMHLQNSGRTVVVTWLGHPDTAPADARASWQRAQGAGVVWADAAPDDLGANDLCIDALLGIGVSSRPATPVRPADARLQACAQALQHSPAPVLAVDLPSGLDADTGQFAPGFSPAPAQHLHTPYPQAPRHTLSLLTLKPGLFTAAGRDAAGQVWQDDLRIPPGHEPPTAWLSGPARSEPRQHASHKGSYGDVAVVGGEGLNERGMGMSGAALLAASAALHGGAGRVLVALLDSNRLELDLHQPELMFRRFDALALEQLTVVCGCGGGQAIARVLPQVITSAARLVLDADALNTIANQAALHALVVARGQHGQPTVLTPHPLEAARLLGLTTAEIQADRPGAARQLAEQFNCGRSQGLGHGGRRTRPRSRHKPHRQRTTGHSRHGRRAGGHGGRTHGRRRQRFSRCERSGVRPRPSGRRVARRPRTDGQCVGAANEPLRNDSLRNRFQRLLHKRQQLSIK